MRSTCAYLAVTISVLSCGLRAGLAQAIAINEIHYHPNNSAVLPGEDPEDLQFIELVNYGTTTLDLSSWYFTDGVACVFPAGTQLAAGEYLLVARAPSFLRSRIPTIPLSVTILAWDAGGDLSNAGELIRLVNASSVEIDHVEYDDVAPWPLGADGGGPSLELVNPAYDNGSASVWRAALATNGSPGTANTTFTNSPVVFSETPARNSVIATLPHVAVTFAEPVRNVAASNLTVNSSLATSVVCASCSGGVGAGPYVFTGFAAPTTSPINIALAPGTIQDLGGDPFLGDNWIYVFNTPNIVINEISYNPPEDPDLVEFIELYNAEATPIDISGWSLTEFASPGYTFPSATILAAGAFVVVAKDPSALLAATGYSTPHQWSVNDSLSNGGEPIRLSDALGIVVDRVVYDDVPPWPTSPDGAGPSLELIDPLLDNSQANAWLASLGTYGTPGAPNSVASNAPRVISETPRRQSAVESFFDVTIVFSAAVTGVDAADLSVAGSAATAVVPSAGPADTYTFTGFSAPPVGVVTVALSAGGIVDGGGHAFAGDSWTVSNGLVIVINEIHYHPADPYGEAEFLELHNAGTNTADLSDWAMVDGVDLVFPSGTALPPGGYLVIAADPALLEARTGYHGALAWAAGLRLSNGGERVALADDAGNAIDAVEYADSGQWPTAADGDGPSLELINPRLPNEYGSAWKASAGNFGTPGAQNSAYQATPPPIIWGVLHDPPIPDALQDVRITATVIDDQPNPTVTLYYRQDFDPTIAYSSTALVDDGFHGDGLAGDHVYGAILAGLAEGERYDFTIRAHDGTSESGAPPGHNTLNAGEYPAQTFLCKFETNGPPTDFPAYHLITTMHTRNLQNNETEDPYDATFIHCSPAGECEIFYNIIEHFRGQSSLHQHPHSFRLNLPDDQPLNSELGFNTTRINLMSQSIVRQHLGYRFFREVFGGALVAPRTQFVRFNVTPLTHGGVQNYIYINVERIDDDFLTSQDGAIQPLRYPDRCSGSEEECAADTDCPPDETCVPTDNGNLYRGRHNDAHLRWEGYDPNAYMVDGAGNNGYELENNEENHDWTDLITLCFALDASTTPDGTVDHHIYEAAVDSVADTREWTRWFGVHMLIMNWEGGIYRDTGDDYYLYFAPPSTPSQLPDDLGHYHANLLVWDMDSVFGGWTNVFTQDSIWRTTVPSPQRFVRSNAFGGRFVGAICDMLDNEFTRANLDPVIDAIPDAVFTQEQGPPLNYGSGYSKQTFKNWIDARRNYVLNSAGDRIRRQLTLSGVPASPYTNSNPVIALSGQLDQRDTRWVVVNGQLADAYSVYSATWSKQHTLVRGVNQIVVQCLDHLGAQVARAEATVLYDPPPASIRLTMPTRMVNTKTHTLKAELLDTLGNVDWRNWNQLGTVSATRVSNGQPVPLTITVFETFNDPNHPGAGNGGPPSTDSIRFYNGVGSVSFTLNNGAAEPAGDIQVTVTVDGRTASGVVTVLDATTPGLFQDLSGTLSGGNLTWEPADGVIHLTGHVSVPSGQTLTILPGTLIMVDAGAPSDGTRITLNGATLQAQGSQADPIYFFATNGPTAMILPQQQQNNPPSWGGITLTGAGQSTATWVFLTGAGNGVVTGHPRPPVIRLEGSHSFTATDCVFADAPGKILYGHGTGVYTVQRCLFSRNGIGGEFLTSSGLYIDDCWFTRIGRAEEQYDCDGDVLHIDFGGTALIRRCIMTDGGDDVVDHSGSATPVLENCIIYDFDDKVISIGGGGTITMTNCLMFRAPGGVRCASRPAILTHCTVGPGTNVNGQLCDGTQIQKCIFWTNSADTCCGDVDYTLVGNAGHLGCGDGNLSADPLFLDSNFSPPSDLAVDFNLQFDSPARTAGPTGGRIGWLGFPTADSCVTNGDCEDGNPCTTDTCDNGFCAHTPIPGCCVANGDCDDGLYCNGVETCGAGNTCVAGTPVSCSTPTPYCDESTDSCVACLTDAHCSDSDACDGEEVCQGGTCAEGVPPDCDDGNPCTDDSCSPASGCVYTNNSNACDDNIGCTINDTCVGGACVGTDNCPMGWTCNHTTGACEVGPQTVTFQNGFNGYADTVDTFIQFLSPDADNGALEELRWDTEESGASTPIYMLIRFEKVFSTDGGPIPPGAQILSAALSYTVGGTNATGDPGNLHEALVAWAEDTTYNTFGGDPGVQSDEYGATSVASLSGAQLMTYSVSVLASLQAWSADPASNRGWIVIPTASDGVRVRSSEYTTSPAERPKLTVEYIVGCDGPEDCDDGNACTTDECVAGSCANTPIPGCCQSAADCNDGNPCTDDACVSNACVYTNNTIACDDGNACTTSDACSGGACVGGAPLDCDDGIDCTLDACDPQSGCTHTDNCPSGELCNHATGDCETPPAAPPLPIVVGDTWRYFKGSVEPPADWHAILFDDSGWLSGASGFGYGGDCTAQRGTLLSDMQNSYASIYTRRAFHVPNPSLITSLTLTIDYDDAFVVYFNGVEVVRRNVVGNPPAHDQLATADHECSTCNGTCNAAEVIDLTAETSHLVAGTNVIAIQAHNLTLGSSDFTLLATMTSTEIPSCTSDPDCDDGVFCNGAETCNLATHTCELGTPPSCDDGIPCTTDSCNPTSDACENLPNDALCDDGQYCNGTEACVAGTGCVAGSSPCAPDEVCEETTDACLNTPTVSAAGGRYLAVTPPGGLTSVAIQVSSAAIPCLPRYADSDGRLVDTPVLRSSAEWGTVYVGDEEVIPATQYDVRVGVPPTFSSPASATTWLWGDTTGDAAVSVLDILCVLDGFQSIFGLCSLHADDLRGDIPNGAIDVYDIAAVLDAFSGDAYPDADPCAARGRSMLLRQQQSVSLQVVPLAGTFAPGEVVAVDVYAANGNDLRAYQLALSIAPVDFDAQRGGQPPGDGLTVNALLIDTGRPDYLFSGLENYPVTDLAGTRMASAALFGGLPVTESRYLGTFYVRAAGNAAGTYAIGIDSGRTIVLDSFSQPLSVVTVPVVVVVQPADDVPVE